MLTETVDAAVAATLRRLVRGGDARVVLVVERMREAELLEAVECGVAAILWRREATAPRLGQAVLAASRGEGDPPADLLGRLIMQMGRLRRSVQGLPGFTPPGVSEREADILRLVAEGWDTAEIAAKLSYSERTVKNVLHGLTTRRQLRNRAHAVAYALREGYIWTVPGPGCPRWPGRMPVPGCRVPGAPVPDGVPRPPSCRSRQDLTCWKRPGAIGAGRCRGRLLRAFPLRASLSLTVPLPPHLESLMPLNRRDFVTRSAATAAAPPWPAASRSPPPPPPRPRAPRASRRRRTRRSRPSRNVRHAPTCTAGC